MSEELGGVEIFENRRRPRSLRQVAVAADGLSLIYRTRTVVVPWSEVYGIRLREQAAEVQLADRKLWLDARFGDWPRLARLIEERSPLVQGQGRGQDVSAEQIANWLGIPRDGALTVTLNTPRWVIYAGLAFMVLIFIAAAAGGNSGSFGGLMQLPMILIALLLSAERVTADADGIVARVKGRPKRFAWAAIESISSGGHYWEVKTTHDKFRIANAAKHSAELVRAIQHVVASRNAGMHLPSTAPLPEGALSRPGEGAAQAELGLSRVGDRPAARLAHAVEIDAAQDVEVRE